MYGFTLHPIRASEQRFRHCFGDAVTAGGVAAAPGCPSRAAESVHLAAPPGLEQHEKLTILPVYKQQPLVSPGRLRASKGLPWFLLSGPRLHARDYPDCHWP